LHNLIFGFVSTRPSREGPSLHDRTREDFKNTKKQNAKEERKQSGVKKTNFGGEGLPASLVKSRGMDSHTRLELCTTLGGTQRRRARYPMGTHKVRVRNS